MSILLSIGESELVKEYGHETGIAASQQARLPLDQNTGRFGGTSSAFCSVWMVSDWWCFPTGTLSTTHSEMRPGRTSPFSSARGGDLQYNALLNLLLWKILHGFHDLFGKLRHWDVNDPVNVLDRYWVVWVRAKRKADLSVFCDGIVVEIELLSVLDLWDIHGFLYFGNTSICRWNTAGTTHPGNGPNLPDRNRHVYHSIVTLELTNIHRNLYYLNGWCLALYLRWNVHLITR